MMEIAKSKIPHRDRRHDGWVGGARPGQRFWERLGFGSFNSFNCFDCLNPFNSFNLFKLFNFFNPFASFSLPLLLAFLAWLPCHAAAQPASPHIGYVYPAGGRQRSTFQAVVGGQFLNGATNVFVSGSGVQAVVLELTKPLTPKELNDLRQKMKELQDKRMAAMEPNRPRTGTNTLSATNLLWTAGDRKLMMEIRRKLFTLGPRRNLNPAIAETVTLEMTLTPDAEPGDREVRLRTSAGLSNPLLFRVGRLPEFTKPAATSAIEPAARNQRRLRQTDGPTPPTEMTITLPAVINGQILPGGVDWFRFKAREGQKLVVAASARQLIPYLADAVPGWFQAALALYDAKGHELEQADHFLFHPDPVLYYVIPRDGEYLLQIRDSIYRGREDFVYRITIGELPFITSAFPLGAQAGTETIVQLKGWNLPVTTLTFDAKDKPPGIYPLALPSADRILNPAIFAVDALPECVEQEPNDQPETAQAVTLPLLVNGRIDKPGDRDTFRFVGRAGQQIVAEVYARRLNSPLDSVLKLTDARGRQLAFNDDHEDKGAGLLTHQADSWLCATLPANGIYYLQLSDAQQHGGADYAYRLRLSPPQPDFALRVVSSSINVRSGGTVPLTVYALRRDGFTNEIALSLKDVPNGFSLSGGRIPANQDQVRLTLTALIPPAQEPFTLTLEGRSLLQGKEIAHTAIPAEDMMQAFAYRHLVPAKEFKVAVSGRFMPRAASLKVLGAMPVKIPAGGTARLELGGPANLLEGQVELELNQPPDGIAIQKVSPSGRRAEIVLQSDAAKVKPGLTGNLIVYAFGNRPFAARAKAAPNRQRTPLTTLPAIPFEIVAH